MNGCLTCARLQTGKCYALCCYCRGDFQRLSEAQTQGLPDRHNKKVYSAQKKLHYLKYWSGKTLFVYLRQHLLLTGDDSPFSFSYTITNMIFCCCCCWFCPKISSDQLHRKCSGNFTIFSGCAVTFVSIADGYVS